MAEPVRWIEYPGTRAEIYERYLVPALFGPFAHDLLTRVGLQPGERVLDVACGTGVVARLAAERVGAGGAVVGLDLNPGMLAVAQSQPDGRAVAWLLGSALALPFADQSFDVVLCQQGVQFFPDPLAGLREIRWVLRPGGRAALSVWGPIDHCPAYAALARVLARHVGPAAAALPPFALSDRGALQRLLHSAGFRDVAATVVVRTVRFPSAAAFVSQVAAGAPTLLGALAGVDQPTRDAVLAAAIAALAPFTDGSGLSFPVEWLHLTAVH